MTSVDKSLSIVFNRGGVLRDFVKRHDLYQLAIAPDKGKPAARRGRKAVSLWLHTGDCLVAEGDRKRPRTPYHF